MWLLMLLLSLILVMLLVFVLVLMKLQQNLDVALMVLYARANDAAYVHCYMNTFAGAAGLVECIMSSVCPIVSATIPYVQHAMYCNVDQKPMIAECPILLWMSNRSDLIT